jgi:probable HAF family extracellular repeat protein
MPVKHQHLRAPQSHLKVLLLPLAATFAINGSEAGTLSGLDPLPGGNSWSATGITDDGATIIGSTGFRGGSNLITRWTSAGTEGLDPMGCAKYSGVSISGDGTTLYGSYYNYGVRAYRAFCSTATGATDLGTLGGTGANANGASRDGSVIVGYSNGKAFRWTAADGMTDLGTLGGPGSFAYAISANGLVVTGYADTGTYLRAFRWTAAGGMTDLGALSGTNSYGRALSADGSVVVGNTYVNDGGRTTYRAFRWTAESGMVDLGTLGGQHSIAYAVSADGKAVAGNSYVGSLTHAFRWTAKGGMEDIGVLPGDVRSSASAISADGSIVVGYSMDADRFSHAFIYKSRVMLDVQDWLGSIGGVNSVLSVSKELIRMHMEGAHHRPLAELGLGNSFWATGDITSSSRTRDVLTRSGEAGGTFAPTGNLLVGIGGGYGLQDQDLANAGSARIFGQYLVAEADLLRPDGAIFSLLGSFGDWKNTYDRGYVTGSGIDYSHGQTNLTSQAVRLRYDSPALWRAYGTEIKAYVSYALITTEADAFTETDGSYAGSFNAMDHTGRESRLGLAASKALGEKVNVRLSAEWIRRFDNDAAPLTATDITSTLTLALPTPDPVRDQARLGMDIDFKIDAKTVMSFTVHAASVGESPDISGAISMRRTF